MNYILRMPLKTACLAIVFTAILLIPKTRGIAYEAMDVVPSVQAQTASIAPIITEDVSNATSTVLSRDEVKALVNKRLEGNPQKVAIYDTIQCESQFNPLAEGDVNIGGVGTTSWGLVQIHLPKNPTITKAQALDPKFSLDFIIKEFAKGNQEKWSCYKILSS